MPHPLGHLSPLLWMDVLHCVLVKTLASRAQHIEPEVSYTKVCTGTGKQCPLFHSLSQEHSRSSWDHWVICLAASSLLRAGHPLPWSLPVPYSMTFKGACQPLSSLLNQSDESRKGKCANWAHQGLEFFQEGTGGPSPDRESELEEWGWNCLQPWLLEPHSGGENVAKQDPKVKNKTDRLSLWFHSCLRLVPAPFFPVMRFKTGKAVSFLSLINKRSLRQLTLWAKLYREDPASWRSTCGEKITGLRCSEDLEGRLRRCWLSERQVNQGSTKLGGKEGNLAIFHRLEMSLFFEPVILPNATLFVVVKSWHRLKLLNH